MLIFIRLLFCFLTVFALADDDSFEELFLSTPDQLSALRGETGYLAGGLVSPMSGQLSLRNTDLIVKGAQEISLTRIYIPPYMPSSFAKSSKNREFHDKQALQSHLANNYKGWQFFPHLRLQFNPHSKEVRLCDPSGATFDFRLDGSNTILASLPFAISNVVGEEPSGKYDPRNTRISYEEDKITVYAPDGTVRIYAEDRSTRKRYLFFLQKEILPNGKVIKFHYNERKNLSYVESLDPKERYVYASLQITGSPRDGSCHFTSSSSTTASYTYQTRLLECKIKEKNSKTSSTLHCSPILTTVSSPLYRGEALSYCGRFLLVEQLGKDHPFQIIHRSYGDDLHYRAYKIYLPVGVDNTFESVYDLNYYPPVAGKKEGATHVKNQDGTSTYYHFSPDLLLTSVHDTSVEGILLKKKIFSYDSERNFLESISLQDGDGNLIYERSYKSDRFGNPILETFTGDLIGNGTKTSYTTTRIFSDEGKNLLIREDTENGKSLFLTYLPGTNLITSKFTKDQGNIILREFFIYDDCYNLTQKILDDGKSESLNDLINVSQRTYTKYTLRQKAPFLHMPEWIENGYFDLTTGSEVLITKRHLLYDVYGTIREEAVYDAKGELAYTLYKEYNERGDLLSEINPLGQKATYIYDTKGRLETQKNFSGRLETTTHHDLQGRLIEQIEMGDDGILHKTQLSYDFQDRLKEKIDALGNSTFYSYDLNGNKITKINFPNIDSLQDGSLAVTTSTTYDSLAKEILKIDANGNTTTYTYGAYGLPIKIHHPNGGTEIFLYGKDSTLVSHTDQDGLTTLYKKDVLGRILSKTFLLSDKILAEETFTYSGFNLLTETDKEGYVTKYCYDGAGRKIKEKRLDKVIDFTYDSLGRLETICKHNKENTLYIHYEKDLLGNILTECKTDISGHILYKISYTYDKDGNQDSITRYINRKEATDTFRYDSLGRLIFYQDGKGFITRTSYDENHINTLGQQVLKKTITNPKSIQTVLIHDPFLRLAQKEMIDANGKILSSEERFYDPHGNLTHQKNPVYEEGFLKNTQIIKYTYTPDHQVESLIKAFGTKEANLTTYTYLPSGKLKTKTLPDRVTLTYDYHPLGFLSQLSSSDKQILHTFTYNKLGYLQEATDERLRLSITRKVDPFGNVLQENFPSDITLFKEYDAFDRLTYLNLEKTGGISYSYDPLHLRQVTRFSPSGKALYSHNYDEYDLDGNLTVERLIGNLGQVIHTLEERGLKTSILSPYFTQYLDYNCLGNLIQNKAIDSHLRYSYDGLSQLTSEEGSSSSALYSYDSLYNRIQKNKITSSVNALNQLISSSYDLNGNQTLQKNSLEEFILSYDPLNRLIEATSSLKKITFIYDPLGRRLSRTLYTSNSLTQELYLYQGHDEIGTLSQGKLINFRTLGLFPYKNYPLTVGIELEDRVFAPILDVQGNICKLVDLESKEQSSYEFTSFGEDISSTKKSFFNPWRFASKRFDPDLGLIYFGKRDYDPILARWLTKDPAGFIDSVNLYQYVLNNPFRYLDPTGEFVFALPLLVWGAEFVLPTLSALIIPTLYGATTVAVAYAGYKAAEWINESSVSKTVDVYAPDRPLPNSKDGIHLPDTDAPHTQLGIKEGRKGKYPQAREYDEKGNPVRDIDFTDHGRPQNHPNPHQHEHKPNPTGGTHIRDPIGKPVPEWSYNEN